MVVANDQAEGGIELSTSESFFRLTTESIRLFSNTYLSYVSIEEVIVARADQAVLHSGEFDVTAVDDHLRIIPSDGFVKMRLAFDETSFERINQAKASIEDSLSRNLSITDAMSVLLFDYIAETESNRIIIRLGLHGDEAIQYRDALKRERSNVIKLR